GRRERDPAGDVPAGPVRARERQTGRRARRVHAAPAVDDDDTLAVGRDGDAARDVPTRPVGGRERKVGGGTERMYTAEAVEDHVAAPVGHHGDVTRDLEPEGGRPAV